MRVDTRDPNFETIKEFFAFSRSCSGVPKKPEDRLRPEFKRVC